MAILEILTAPDPRLTMKSLPVEKVDASVRKLMDNLLVTLYDNNGVGIAAVQIGIHQRVIAIDLGDKHSISPKPLFMANPELTWLSPTTQTTAEACLSVPNFSGNVIRPLEISVTYLDENNQKMTLDVSGLMADCIQHEIDHLNGILYIEHLSSLKRNLILNKLSKIKRRQR